MRVAALALLTSLVWTGCDGADPPATSPPGAGPTKLHLIFTGNVHGEIEPCG